MKSVKQFLESTNIIENDSFGLSSALESGLFDSKRIELLEKILSNKNYTQMERDVLTDFIRTLSESLRFDDYLAEENNLSKFDDREKPGYPKDSKIPVVLMLKRKAIRVYPDHQKVALYYAQAIDKYITIPYNNDDTGIAMVKEGISKYTDMATKAEIEDDPKLRTRAKLHLNLISNKKKYPKTGDIRKDVAISKVNSNIQRINKEKAEKEAMPKLKDGITGDPFHDIGHIAGFAAGKAIGAGLGVLKSGMKSGIQKAKSLKMTPKPVKAPLVRDVSSRNIVESMRAKLAESRIVNEAEEDEESPLVAAGKDLTPILGTKRAFNRVISAYNKGDYKGAALHGAATVLSGVGDAALVAGVGAGVKLGAAGLSRAASKAASSTASTLSKAAETTGAVASKVATGAVTAGSKAKEAVKSRIGAIRSSRAARASNRLRAAAGLANSGNGDNSPTKYPEKEIPQPHQYNFSLKAQESRPQRSVDPVIRSGADSVRFNKQMLSPGPVRESTLDDVLIKSKKGYEIVSKNQDIINISNTVARELKKTFNSLNEENKSVFLELMKEDTDDIKKAIKFAIDGAIQKG